MAVSTNGKAKARMGEAGDVVPAGGEAFEAPATIVVPKLRKALLQLPVKGITPLLVCAMSQKVSEDLMAKTQGKAKNKKDAKNPEQEWQEAKHLSPDGWEGLHAGSFRGAIIDAARSVEGVTMTALKQGIFVRADGFSTQGSPLVRVYGKSERHDGFCRTTTGVTYPRHRPIYPNWRAVLTLEVNLHLLSVEAAVNLVSIAGWSCGVGEWRPSAPKSRTGDMGRFEIVDSVSDLAAWLAEVE